MRAEAEAGAFQRRHAFRDAWISTTNRMPWSAGARQDLPDGPRNGRIDLSEGFVLQLGHVGNVAVESAEQRRSQRGMVVMARLAMERSAVFSLLFTVRSYATMDCHGHNTSRQKAAAYVREQLLAGYSDWHLIADSDRCSRQGVVPMAVLAKRRPDITVSTTLARLRCAICLKPPSAVRLERNGRVVAIAGPWSY